MKKVLGILAALVMAAPSMAMTLAVTDGGGGWIEISYDASGETALPRAFALNITVDAAHMDAVQFSAGTGDEACATCEPFDIYPGTIAIDENGVVTGWGTPVAPATAPDAPGQLYPAGAGTAIVVELGSLYEDGVETPPADTGLLLRVHVDGNCTLCVSEEDTVRGGVVMEDVTSATVAQACETIVGVLPTCWDATECGGQPLGDASCDGNINLVDLFKIKTSWMKSYGETGYNCCANFDHTGSVNLVDLFRIKTNWMTTGHTPATGNQNCPAE
jgi:hypothetical protein